MSWELEGDFLTDVPTGFVGFVYEISNLLDGRKYIGKKSFIFKIAKKPLKGQKRRRISYEESDWRDYFGSNTELQADVARHGVGNFHRRILMLCKTKAEMSYYEAKFQLETDAILRDDYYNSWVSVKVTRKHMASK